MCIFKTLPLPLWVNVIVVPLYGRGERAPSANYGQLPPSGTLSRSGDVRHRIRKLFCSLCRHNFRVAYGSSCGRQIQVFIML
ncbi:hypothetical protein CEXT_701201 [Caerostris extrusa]|uniref:Secreted protein n=1 Tax=Caerostris extrusa TaxID=172846 RepID=A0AAV4NSM6_CAEEX|nr:hypothetical protein CEXT_701201 [Caerostris extrusa]